MRSLFFAVAVAAGLFAAESQAQGMPNAAAPSVNAPGANAQATRVRPEQDAMSARIRKNRPAKRTYSCPMPSRKGNARPIARGTC